MSRETFYVSVGCFVIGTLCILFGSCATIDLNLQKCKTDTTSEDCLNYYQPAPLHRN